MSTRPRKVIPDASNMHGETPSGKLAEIEDDGALTSHVKAVRLNTTKKLAERKRANKDVLQADKIVF